MGEINHNRLRLLSCMLIAFPEPVTTVCGVALLLASFSLPRQRSDSNQKLEVIVKEYLRSKAPVDLGYYPHFAGTAVFHRLNSRSRFSVGSSCNFFEKTGMDFSSYHPAVAARVAGRVVHHRLKTGVLRSEDTVKVNPEIRYHPLKTGLPGRYSDNGYKTFRSVTGPARRGPDIIHHSLKIKQPKYAFSFI